MKRKETSLKEHQAKKEGNRKKKIQERSSLKKIEGKGRSRLEGVIIIGEKHGGENS